VPLGLSSNKLTPFVVTGDGKARDSRDTEGSTIRRAAEFGEAISTGEPWQKHPEIGSSPKLSRRTAIANRDGKLPKPPLFDDQPNSRSQRKLKSKDLPSS
jgi:hypothetical protein